MPLSPLPQMHLFYASEVECGVLSQSFNQQLTISSFSLAVYASKLVLAGSLCLGCEVTGFVHQHKIVASLIIHN